MHLVVTVDRVIIEEKVFHKRNQQGFLFLIINSYILSQTKDGLKLTHRCQKRLQNKFLFQNLCREI